MSKDFKNHLDGETTLSVNAVDVFHEDYIKVLSYDGRNSITVLLDRSNAIKLHRELKKQISFLNE